MLQNSAQAYGSVSRFFHWSIALLVLLMIPLGFLMGDIENQAWKIQAYTIHKQIGLFILALMLLRIVWALTNIKPALPFMTPLWQRWCERVVHFSLYAALVVLPLSGWIGSVAAGYAPQFAGYTLNLPVMKSEKVTEIAFGYFHIPFVYLLIALLALHVLAALYHHFIKRDDVLRRMLSKTRQR
jgi:cytochrome b561